MPDMWHIHIWKEPYIRTNRNLREFPKETHTEGVCVGFFPKETHTEKDLQKTSGMWDMHLSTETYIRTEKRCIYIRKETYIFIQTENKTSRPICEICVCEKKHIREKIDLICLTRPIYSYINSTEKRLDSPSKSMHVKTSGV